MWLTFTKVIGVVVPSMSSKSALVEAGMKTVAIFRSQTETLADVSLINSNTAVKPNTASLWLTPLTDAMQQMESKLQ